MSLEFRIPATDLTFEWSNCKACFWAKHRLKWKKPYTPFPSVFGVIDKVMRGYWDEQPAHEVDKSLPVSPLETKAKSLLSTAIAIPVQVEESRELIRMASENGKAIPLSVSTVSTAVYTETVSIRLSGSIDMMSCGEVTGLVVDCKTSSGMTPEKALFYAPQLWAYRHALENPEKGDRIRVDHLGLLVMEPKRMISRTLMEVTQAYFPLPTDGLMPFLSEVAHVLAGPEPKNPDCPWCGLRHAQK